MTERPRGERTRARLLELAVRRFGERGYRETALSSIARDAGVTPAAVYAYFPDKDGLFEAALDQDVTAWMTEALADRGAGLAAWIGLMPRLQATLDQHPLAHRVLAGQEPEMLPRIYRLPASRQLRLLLQDGIRSGQELGAVRGDLDPETLAEGIATVVESTLLAAVQLRQAGAFEDEGRRAGVRALLRAALVPPPSDSQA